MNPTVFLDRDGTIIEDVGFLSRLDQIRIFPWSAGAIKQLNDAGYRVVVATNQGGVARGLYDEDFVVATHAALTEMFANEGARIDAYYYCPHHPTKATIERYRIACACRKPAAGMLRQAAADLQIDLSESWMVGDWWRDVQAGVAAGTRTILVRSGYKGLHGKAPEPPVRPDAILNNLMEAVDWILRSSSRSSTR